MTLKENIVALAKSPEAIALAALSLGDISGEALSAEESLKHDVKKHIVISDTKKTLSQTKEKVINFEAVRNLTPNPPDTTVRQMVESFKKLLMGDRKEYLSSPIVIDAILRWSQIDEKVNYTDDEKLQTEKHLRAIDNRFSNPEERAKRYVQLFQYKIDQQIQEEVHENLNKDVSPEEAIKMLTEEKILDDIAVVNKPYLGESDYIVIFISQKHGEKSKCKDVQEQVYEIKKRLAQRGVGVFVVEGVSQKEFDDESELVFANKLADEDLLNIDRHELVVSMNFETEFGTDVLSMGMEDLIAKKEGDVAANEFFLQKNQIQTTKKSEKHSKRKLSMTEIMYQWIILRRLWKIRVDHQEFSKWEHYILIIILFIIEGRMILWWTKSVRL